jgi:hypothetical protein
VEVLTGAGVLTGGGTHTHRSTPEALIHCSFILSKKANLVEAIWGVEDVGEAVGPEAVGPGLHIWRCMSHAGVWPDQRALAVLSLLWKATGELLVLRLVQHLPGNDAEWVRAHWLAASGLFAKCDELSRNKVASLAREALPLGALLACGGGAASRARAGVWAVHAYGVSLSADLCNARGPQCGAC